MHTVLLTFLFMYSVPLLAVPPDVSLHSVGFFKRIDRNEKSIPKQDNSAVPTARVNYLFIFLFIAFSSVPSPCVRSGCVISSS